MGETLPAILIIIELYRISVVTNRDDEHPTNIITKKKNFFKQKKESVIYILHNNNAFSNHFIFLFQIMHTLNTYIMTTLVLISIMTVKK